MLNKAARRSLLSVLALPFLTACAGGPGDLRTVAIDGDLDEWRGGAVTIADADSVYFRFSPGQAGTLQANNETTRLAFDLDDNPSTGKRLDGPPDVGTLGVDLEIMFSPPLNEIDPGAAQRVMNRRIQRGEPASPFTSGMTVLRHQNGVMTRHSHADVGFMASPAYAAEWFEAKLDRHAPALAGTGLDRAGSARGIVLITDGQGGVARYSDPFVFVLPEPGTPRHATARIPTQPEGTIRVLSMNVLRGKPIADPAPFARLIAAIRPDVILFQEADDMTTEALEAWLSGYVGPLPGKHEWADGVQSLAGGVGAWDAASLPEFGVAIASPHLVTRVFDEPVVINDPDSGRPRTTRALFALVSTPAGDVLACTTHLKCCGSAGSREDLIRMAEVAAINERYTAIADAIRAESGEVAEARVIGGDLNLVGSRGPLDLLREGLASNGGDLAAVDTPVLGSDAWYTWRDDRSSFGPGRLDWLLVGDARVAQAFSLDTRVLDPGVLALWGLEQNDSAVSDHLPVVVDLRP